MSRQDEILDELFDSILDGERDPTVALVNEALELDMGALTLLFDAMIPALEEVGRLFEMGEYFVQEMLISASATSAALLILSPLIAQTVGEPIGIFVMGTVKGDIHDIGKNLCCVMLEGAGFDVIDLGVNVPPAAFIAAIKEHKPDAVGMSAFLTTTMPMFKVNIKAIVDAGLRDKVKILVGGAPVTQEYCEVVGADGFAKDASKTVRLTKELIVVGQKAVSA